MSSDLFDNQLIEFTCAKCGNKFSETVRRLRSNPYPCLNCGTVYDTKEFRGAIEDSQKAYSKLLSEFKKLG